MSATQMRDELHQFINRADDRMLNLLYGMMKADEQVDPALAKSIEKGLAESKAGKHRDHEEVMAEFRSRSIK
jgi:hypothetical protein